MIQKQKADAQTRKDTIKSMEKVLAIPSGTPKRWRAAYDHFLRQRPDAKADAEQIAEYVQERRQKMDKFASTKNGRMVQSTPPWLIRVLQNTDPEYFGGRNAKDFSEAKHLRLLKRAFPEFFYAEVI